MSGQTEPKNWRRFITYALPGLPMAAVGLPLSVHLPPFYVELGLSMSAVGLIFMLTRFWDLISDPLLGVLSDRLRLFGLRRKPWMIASVPVLMLAVGMIFMPPFEVSFGYLLFWLIVLYSGTTMLEVSHQAWAAELAPGYHEQSVIQSVRQGVIVVGLMFVLVIPTIIGVVVEGDSSRPVMTAIAALFGLCLPVTIWIATRRVPEKKHVKPATDLPSLNMLKSYWQVLRHGGMRLLLAMDIMAGLAMGTIASLFLFMMRDGFGFGDETYMLLVVYFIAGLSGLPLVVKLAQRWGKRQTLLNLLALNCVLLPLMLLLPYQNFLLVAVGMGLFGVGAMAAGMLIKSMTADLIVDDERRHGENRAGTFVSAILMTNKAGGALAIGLVFIVLEQAFGYAPGTENSAAAIQGLRLAFCVAPVAFMSVGLIAIHYYREPEHADRDSILPPKDAALSPQISQ